MRYAKITYPDINNGSGFRVSLFFQGCSIHCKNCFNKKIWDFSGGKAFTEETKNYLFKILNKPYISGLSLLGGEPLDQNSEELTSLLKEIKEKFPEKTIWLYTGYTFRDVPTLINNYLDVVVDGPFVEELKDSSLAFRGSINQNIIYVQKKEFNNNISN